jgi:outer membrane receptor protein involved in Fe transport
MRNSLASFAALLCTCALPGTAVAALRAPAGRLDAAVIALGRQARVSIGISEPRLAMLRARAAEAGDVDAALSQMLAGSGAAAVRVGPRSWRIVRKPAPLYRRRVRQAPSPPPPPRRPEDPPEEEIVVIASKRDALLADYPSSVSRLGAEQILPGTEAQGPQALASQIPSLTSTHLGPGRNKLFVRGLADSSFNGPTQATVGEYFGEARLNYNGPDPDLRLYDLRSVEVLEGPQGTLHGVGTLGGVIRIQPAPPDLTQVGGTLDLGLSATEHGAPGGDASGTINLPLSSTLGFRAVGYRVREGGYIDDLLRDRKDVNRVDTVGGRAWLRFEPDNEWTIDLSGVVQRIEGRDSQYADKGDPPLTKGSPIAEGFGSRYLLANLAIRKSWNGLTLSSATSIARQRIHESFDASRPGAPTRFDQESRVDFFSNENRLSREAADGSGWVVGTSIVRNRYRLDRDFAPITFLAARVGGVSNSIDEATVFGEASFNLADRLRASIGGRATLLQLSGAAVNAPTLLLARDAANKADRTQLALLPSLSLAWRARNDLFVYGRYQQSFRPGGIVVRDTFVARYRPDNVKSAEVGLRYNGLGRAVQLASALAVTEWRNIQADQIDGDGLPTIANIGDGRIVTLDLKASILAAPGLSIDLAGVLADSRLTSPSVAAFASLARSVARSSLPNVARLNASASLPYGTAIGAIDLSASGWARYDGPSRLGVGPVLSHKQGDYLDTGLALRATKGRYALSVTLTNLLDQVGNRFALGSPFMLGQEEQLTPLRPRTLRLGLEAAF